MICVRSFDMFWPRILQSAWQMHHFWNVALPTTCNETWCHLCPSPPTISTVFLNAERMSEATSSEAHKGPCNFAWTRWLYRHSQFEGLESITWTDCGISSKCPWKTLSTCFVWFVFVVLTCSDPESSSLLDRDASFLRCGPTHNLQRNMMSSLSQSTYHKYSISQCWADEWGHVKRSPQGAVQFRLNQVIVSP